MRAPPLRAETNWTRIANLYATLVAVTRSPIVRLNHAVAVGMAQGPAADWPSWTALMAEGELDTYHYAPSVRGDLLEKLGRHAEARAEFERAARLTKNARERDLLSARAQACGPSVRLIPAALSCVRVAPRHGGGWRATSGAG